MPLPALRRTAQVLIHTARGRSRPFLVLGGAAAAIFAASCVHVDRALVMPVDIPGSSFVGSEACAECHGSIHEGFAGATHAKLDLAGSKGEQIGCEACHGPGSKHVQTGGEFGTILNPKQDATACYQCHLSVNGQFNLPHSHPVNRGLVTCTECHDPHKGRAVPAGGTALASENETCAQCHTAQGGPFMFEHEAMRDGCTTCHSPHGSVNEKMLKVRNANLCLQCHITENVGSTVQIGGRDHTAFLSRGTCWAAGCHEAIHGSNASSSLRY